MTEFSIDHEHLVRQYNFSQETFGPGPRLAGVINHIGKEIAEVREHPHDVSEWADLIILAFDGALRQGFMPQVILNAVRDKQEINEHREWPDWRLFSQDKAIEHVREVLVPSNPCGSINNRKGWICTLEFGHEGVHKIPTDETKQDYYIWPDE